MNDHEQEYLTGEEAARYIRRSRVWLWQKRKGGEVAYIRSGRNCLFRKKDLDAFMLRQLINAEASAANEK